MTTSVNYEFNPANYGNNVGAIPGHGCQGTCNSCDAADGKFVDTNKIQSGGDGYSATDEAPGPIMGPAAGYSIIKPYHQDVTVRDTEVPANFSGSALRGSPLLGGKRKRMTKKSWGGKKKGFKHTKKVHKKHHKRTRMHKMKRSRYVRTHHRHSTMWKHTGGKTKRHHKSKRHMKRGGSTIGGPQPYSNVPITFGQTFDTKLGPNESALANPTPLLPYSRCETIARN